MLPKKNRFSFKSKLPKQIINSPSFNVRHDENGEELKVAVVVSKKVDKRAVVRNKIKRQILEIVNSINLGKPLSLVFYVKAQALSSKDLEKEIKAVLGKI